MTGSLGDPSLETSHLGKNSLNPSAQALNGRRPQVVRNLLSTAGAYVVTQRIEIRHELVVIEGNPEGVGFHPVAQCDVVC